MELKKNRLMKISKHVPSIFTATNLIFGFIAILINDPLYSPLLIVASSFFDVMDGAIARKFNATSLFGAELDSLADLVSFIIAPAFLYYNHVLVTAPKIQSIIVICILVVFGALRLAKFNIDTEQTKNFKGVPSPTTGVFFSFLVFETHANTILNYNENIIIWLVLPLIFAFLMVSPFHFISLKKSNSRKKKILLIVFTIMFFTSLILWAITKMPFVPLAIIIYIVSSILLCRKGC